MRVNLETRIKGIVTGLAFCLTLVLMGMALSMDFSESVRLQYSLIQDLVSRGPSMTSAQAVEIMEERGSSWKVTSGKGDGTPLTTSDGAVWSLEPDRQAILELVLHRRRHLLVAAMICLLISAEMAVFMAYWITRPLKRLVWGCARVAKGDLSDIPTEKAGSYELEALHEAFNEMVQGIKGRQEMERRVSRMERLAALGQVVAGVSHEIKNPLASMRIHLDLLGSSFNEEEQESLTVLSSELDRLNRVVTQLLSFARPAPPLPGPVDPEEVLDWCYRMVKVRLQKCGVGWHHHVEEGTVMWADRGQVQQLLLNLVLNALEAIDEGGEIRLSAERGSEGTVLSIGDNGRGIADDVKDRMFDPFVTSKSEGTGLGLSVVYRIMELHRGRIEYSSSQEGTVFTLWFPDEKGDQS